MSTTATTTTTAATTTITTTATTTIMTGTVSISLDQPYWNIIINH
jgi:hypothetical protein